MEWLVEIAPNKRRCIKTMKSFIHLRFDQIDKPSSVLLFKVYLVLIFSPFLTENLNYL